MSPLVVCREQTTRIYVLLNPCDFDLMGVLLLTHINFIYCQPNNYKFRAGAVRVLTTRILRTLTPVLIIIHDIRI